MKNLSHNQIKKIFYYNPDTGEIRKRSGSFGEVANNGYIRFRHKRKSCAAHKIAWIYMTGHWPDSDIDHIDHDRKNNKWTNLRMVSRQDNMRNASLSKANTSGFTGVTWCNQQKQWRAQICVDGKSIKLGRFNEIDEAITARKTANNKYGFHKNHGKKHA